jgi:two-component system, cell cycle sensor histidine kinase and response regulator CckA
MSHQVDPPHISAAAKEKLEIIARLAGSIAHDYNNLLAIILLQSDMLLATPGQSEPVRRRALEIKNATERAAALTRQLLAFGSRQVLQSRPLDVRQTLESLRPAMTEAVGPQHELVIKIDRDVSQIQADPIHLEQVLINLLLNARDAMPPGGRVVVAADTVSNREVEATVNLAPGIYLRLSITDTGAGMDEETQKRIFEPFFTTKPTGQALGLGLSTVYGIVKQFAGTIVARSTVNEGSCFEIYLPHSQATATEVPREPASSERLPVGSETILLVEDEAMVRRATADLVRMYGYQVIEAADAQEALEIFEEADEPISLLLSDVSMPGMDGPALAEIVAARWPELPVLFMSGYAGDAVDPRIRAGRGLIEKPFESIALARRIRELIDAAGQRSATT